MVLPKNVSIVLESKNLKIPTSVFKIDFFEINNSNTLFEKFLISERFRYFQTLTVLQALENDKRFLVAFEKIDDVDYIQEDNGDFVENKITSYENVLIEKDFSCEVLFDSYVARLGLLQIDAVNYVEREFNNSFNFKKQFHDFIKKGEILILKEPYMIICEDAVYVEDKELFFKMQSLINAHNREFKDFLRRNILSANHQIYVRWLLNWFPGRIHIRSLE